MPSIRTATAMPTANGWIMAAELDNDYQHQSQSATADSLLSTGRYVAVLNHIDCEGCAAAVESAVQKIRGIDMAGVSPKTSTLVFEVVSGATVTLGDVDEMLASVSEALRTVIVVSGLRGPFPLVYSAS
jgi:copper chaperone CopZ